MPNSDTLEHTFYLCFKKKQRGFNALSVRCTERQPALESGEVAIRLTAALPRQLFARPLLTARIAIDSSKVTPPTVEADVVDNIMSVVMREIGVDLKLIIETAPENKA